MQRFTVVNASWQGYLKKNGLKGKKKYLIATMVIVCVLLTYSFQCITRDTSANAAVLAS